MSSTFVPPLWSKFGTNLKDLITKKYDYKHQVTVKNNVAADLTVESTVGVNENSSLNGTVKATYKNKDFGQVETEIGTVPNKDKATLSAELKATKFYDGLTIIAKGSDGKPLLKVGAEYRQESVATSVTVEHTKDTNTVEGTLAAGFDGFSVGGQAKYCQNHGLTDHNFGAEYSQPEYALTLKTEDETKKLVGSYWHNVPTGRNKLKTQVGAKVDWNLDSGHKTFTVGTEHDIDEVTTVKAKVNTEGELAAVLEHRLTNPSMRLNLSANWKVQDKTSTPKGFGVALTFGDYA